MSALILDSDAAVKERGEELVAEAAAQGVYLCSVCIGSLHRDGVCRGCEREADPSYRVYRRALAAEDEMNEAYGEPGWDGRLYTAEDRKRDEATQARYERAHTLAEQDSRTPANACARCGKEERGHGVQRHAPFRITDRHEYAAPTDRCRLLRIRARRDAADSRLYRAVARRFEALGGQA